MRMRPGVWRCGNRDHRRQVRASKITLSGGTHCSRRGCAWGGMHGDANVHTARCLVMPCRSTFSRPNDRPVSCRGSHVYLKTSTCGIARHLAACAHIRVSMRAPPHAPPLAAVRAPAEGYFACANPSAMVTVAALPRTQPHAHSRHCACPLPLQCAAPLRVISLTRTCLRRSQVQMAPKAVCLGSHFRGFPPHHPGACLHPFPLLV